MNFLLEIDNTLGIFDEGADLGKILTNGLQIVLIGIVTVFAVLGLLWAFLTVFKMVFYDASRNKSSVQIIDNTAAENVDSTELIDSSDEEIVAVIAAAVAAAESESNGIKFRVVSFRRN